MDSATESHGRWALLIGIDKYPNFGSAVHLEGCTNDVAIMKDALIRRFDFPEDQIMVLLNEQATRDGILAAMEDLTRRVGQDDVVAFHYSGHGSRQPDGPEQDELDGYDETLVPYDSGRITAANRDITDDEIHDWLLRLTNRTENVTLIFDCCHSGTIVRDAFGNNPRMVPPESRPWTDLAVSARPVVAPASTRGRGEGPSGWLPIGEKYVLFAASSSEEAANEIAVGEPRKVIHGALTYHLVQELMDPGFRDPTCLEVFERFAPRLTAQFPSQRPQLEGTRDRQIFGTQTIRPMRYVTVRERKGDSVTLEAGAACGMTKGSRWIVHAPATRTVADELRPCGTVEIVSVQATTSEGEILEEDPQQLIEAGSRAVETLHCLEKARLSVEVLAAPSAAAALLEQLSRSNLLWQARPGEKPGARIYLLSPRPGVQDGDPLPTLKELSEESWAAVGEDGEVLGPIFLRRDPRALKLLVENLESVARLRGVLEIQNAGSALEDLIDFKVLRLDGRSAIPPSQDPSGEPVFSVGDCVVLEIHNKSGRPVYIYVLDIGLTGRVEQVYPPLGAHELLEIDHRIQVGVRCGQELKLFMPDGFALLPQNRGRSPLEGRETLKLFATTSPADFRVLFQPGFKFRSGGSARSLDDFLAATFGGGGYGSLRGGDEDWMTVQKTFLLRARPASASMA